MAWYEVTRACGHSEECYLSGPRSGHRWRLARVEPYKLCEECYRAEMEKRHQEENREAAEAARKMNLPRLSGTEKQVAWAETIRLELLDCIHSRLGERFYAPEVYAIVEYIKETKTAASWWIDHRFVDAFMGRWLQKLEEEMIRTRREASPEALEARIEATVRPENPVTDTVAEIRPLNNFVEIEFPERREDFRQIVREKLNMKWDGEKKCWYRKLSFGTGAAEERVAEAGHRLLAAGFPIRIYDAYIRQRAIAGDYEPECTRWITARTAGDYKGWFAVSWGRGEDFYAVARKLPGSRYDRPDVVVPAEQFEQILDFAQMYDFRLSPGAQQLVEAASNEKERALIVQPVHVSEPRKPEPLTKPPRLEVPSEVDIDEELRDEN